MARIPTARPKLGSKVRAPAIRNPKRVRTPKAPAKSKTNYGKAASDPNMFGVGAYLPGFTEN
jgi:hypothetical protein